MESTQEQLKPVVMIENFEGGLYRWSKDLPQGATRNP